MRPNVAFQRIVRPASFPRSPRKWAASPARSRQDRCHVLDQAPRIAVRATPSPRSRCRRALSAAFPHRHEAGKRQLAETFGVTRDRDAERAARQRVVARQPAGTRRRPALGADQRRRRRHRLDDRRRGVHPHRALPRPRRDPQPSQGVSRLLRHDRAAPGQPCGRQSSASTARACSPGFAENGGIHPFVETAVRQAVFSDRAVRVVGRRRNGPRRCSTGRNPELPAPPRASWWPNPGWAWLQGDEPVTGRADRRLARRASRWRRARSIWPSRRGLGRRGVPARDVRGGTATADRQALAAQLRRHRACSRGSARCCIARPMSYPQRRRSSCGTACRACSPRRAERSTMPVVANVDYGHTSPAGVLPLGCSARVDPVNRTVSVVDAGVN